MTKLTLKEKERINENVSQETKRCLGILEKYIEAEGNRSRMPTLETLSSVSSIERALKKASLEILRGAPYLKFNSDLQKKLKKVE